MGKYIVLYHTPKSAVEAMANATPEEMKKEMELSRGGRMGLLKKPESSKAIVLSMIFS